MSELPIVGLAEGLDDEDILAVRMLYGTRLEEQAYTRGRVAAMSRQHLRLFKVNTFADAVQLSGDSDMHAGNVAEASGTPAVAAAAAAAPAAASRKP